LRRDTAGLGDDLVERGVDAAGLRRHERRQRVEVRALELADLAVLEDRLDDRVLELLERVGLGGPAGLRAAHTLGGEAELVEQELAELLRRADIELAAGELVDLLLERSEARLHVGRELLEVRGVDVNAHALDSREQIRDRQLDIAIERPEATRFDALGELIGDRQERVRDRAGPRSGALDLDRLEALLAADDRRA